MEMEGPSASVRKGAWMREEDILLTKCIEKYGEGKWHRVPYRAGLNRCRKSCRLRWLNYLNPNIKRGAFADDEVELIIRLRNLLGNRWTLIAGRLPGRTANNVKNYCNTHLLKRNVDPFLNPKHGTKVIKPRPLILSKKSFPVCSDETTVAARNSSVSADIGNDSSYCFCNDEIMSWENLMMNDNEIDNIVPSVLGEQAVNDELEVVQEDDSGCLGELYLNDKLWNSFNS